MTPQTVNAYYGSVHEQSDVPAAILQPPYFDVSWSRRRELWGNRRDDRPRDDAVRFDDEARIRRAIGNLKDWWAPAGSAEISRRDARYRRSRDSRFTVGVGLRRAGESGDGRGRPRISEDSRLHGGHYMRRTVRAPARRREPHAGSSSSSSLRPFLGSVTRQGTNGDHDPHPPAEDRTNVRLRTAQTSSRV